MDTRNKLTPKNEKEKNMLDYKLIQQPPLSCGNVKPRVSDEEVLAVANGMAAKGYRFSAASTHALTEVLSGNSVFIYGFCGTGKSLFFKMLSEYSNGINNSTGRPIHPYTFAVVRLGLAAAHSVKEVEEFVNFHDGRPLILDDLGSEAMSSEYGRTMEMADIILQLREFTDKPTHIISNFNGEQLVKRYGVRVVDRMRHSVPMINFGNDTSRAPQGKIPLASTDWYRMFGFWHLPSNANS